jgi:hypothetical protein
MHSLSSVSIVGNSNFDPFHLFGNTDLTAKTGSKERQQDFFDNESLDGKKKVLSMGTLTFLLAQMPNLAYPLLHPSSGEEYHILLSQRPDDT